MCLAADFPLTVHSTKEECFCQPAVLLPVCQKAGHSKNQSQLKRRKFQMELSASVENILVSCPLRGAAPSIFGSA